MLPVEIIGTVYLVCFLVGSTANLLSLVHFSIVKRSTSTMIHRIMNFTDFIFCSIIALPPGISMVSGLEPHLFSWDIFCDFWYISFIVSFRFSIFIIAILSITRAIMIVYPLTRISRKLILSLFAMYFTYLVLRCLIPYHYNRATFQENVSVCVIKLTREELTKIQYILVFSSLETVLPLFPITISCIVSLYTLRKSIQHQNLVRDRNMSHQPQIADSSLKYRAGVTVIILTSVYIIFSITYIMDYFFAFLDVLTDGKLWVYKDLVEHHLDTYYFLKKTIFSSTFLGVINSTINPIVFIVRIGIIRQLHSLLTKTE